jgi:phenylalanyl-tRNA synthetase beta chain
LVEETGRFHGYDAIPEDVQVPMVRSARRFHDRVMDRVRHVLTASGFDEAMTTSVVTAEMAETFSPWTDAPPLRSMTPILRGADCLRRSLVPSLLVAQQTNQSLANRDIDLFESAHVYLAAERTTNSGDSVTTALPSEEMMLAISSRRELLDLKGVVEAIVDDLRPDSTLEVRAIAHDLFEADRYGELWLDGERLGVIGQLSSEGLARFDLREAISVAELKISYLEHIAQPERRYDPFSIYPAIDRDINLIFDEYVRWADVADLVRTTAGPLLERLEYRGTYRDAKIGDGKKSLLVFVALRNPEATLTGAEADEVRDRIVAACGAKLGGVLRR